MKNAKSFLLLLCILFTVSCSKEDEFDRELNSGRNRSLNLNMEGLEQFGPSYVQRVLQMDLPTSYALPQNVYEINVYPSVSSIDPEGQRLAVTAQGTFSHFLIKVSDFVLGQDVATGTVVGTGTSGFGYLDIPAYEPNLTMHDIRFLIFYFYNDTNQWEPFYYASQVGIVQYPFQAFSNITEDIPGKGEEYIIEITGSYPKTDNDYVVFRAVDNDENVISDMGIIGGTTQKSVNLTIKANPENKTRQVYLQYNFNLATGDWVIFEQHTQLSATGGGGENPNPGPGDNHQLSTGRYLAKRDALSGGIIGSEKMTWAVAAGVDLTENNRYTDYITIPKTNLTGCNSYFEKEDGSDKGKWYLPTKDELEEIFYDQRYYGLYPDLYWSYSSPAVGENRYCYAIYYNENSPIHLSIEKSDPIRVRCVYGIPQAN